MKNFSSFLSLPLFVLLTGLTQAQDVERELTYNGEISFLHRINAIGTKFHAAHNMGPQGVEDSLSSVVIELAYLASWALAVTYM